MREPGNTSGVARVTFPNEPGSYLVSYISNGTILGEISIPVPSNNESQFQSTFDTENYSPKFLSTLRNNFSALGAKESSGVWETNGESTLEFKLSIEKLKRV